MFAKPQATWMPEQIRAVVPATTGNRGQNQAQSRQPAARPGPGHRNPGTGQGGPQAP